MHNGPYHRPHHRPASGRASGGGSGVGSGGTSVGALSVPFGGAILVTPSGQHRIPRYGTHHRPHTVVRRPPQRRPPQRRAPNESQRPMQLLMSGLGALIMVAICGLSVFFVVADERRGPALTTTPAGVLAVELTPARLSIDSRIVDPTPLTAREVFPRTEITMVPGASPYRLHTSRTDASCSAAATGALRKLLRRYDCSQVVRATLIAPIGRYPVTVGVVNMPDDGSAKALSDAVKTVVDARTGSFAGLVSDRVTRPVRLKSAQVSWQTHGHYLLYCVIARPDGRIVADDDPFARHIVFDMIDSYLHGVIDRRTAAEAP